VFIAPPEVQRIRTDEGKALLKGERPPKELSRPEVADVLIASMRG